MMMMMIARWWRKITFAQTKQLTVKLEDKQRSTLICISEQYFKANAETIAYKDGLKYKLNLPELRLKSKVQREMTKIFDSLVMMSFFFFLTVFKNLFSCNHLFSSTQCALSFFHLLRVSHIFTSYHPVVVFK